MDGLIRDNPPHSMKIVAREVEAILFSKLSAIIYQPIHPPVFEIERSQNHHRIVFCFCGAVSACGFGFHWRLQT